MTRIDSCSCPVNGHPAHDPQDPVATARAAAVVDLIHSGMEPRQAEDVLDQVLALAEDTDV